MIVIQQLGGAGGGGFNSKPVNITDFNLALKPATYFGSSILNSPTADDYLCQVTPLTNDIILQKCYPINTYELHKNYYTRVYSESGFSPWRVNLELTYYDVVENVQITPITNIDWRTTGKKVINITSELNISFTFTNPLMNTTVQLLVNKSTITPGTLVFPPQVKWPDSVAYNPDPSLGTDVVLFIFDGTTYYGSVLTNYN